jgi:hypothetical protein
MAPVIEVLRFKNFDYSNQCMALAKLFRKHMVNRVGAQTIRRKFHCQKLGEVKVGVFNLLSLFCKYVYTGS